MEEDVTAFLKRIVKTIGIGLLFLFVNMTAGIYFNLAFFNSEIQLKNIVFYVFFLASLFFVLRYLLKIWGRI